MNETPEALAQAVGASMREADQASEQAGIEVFEVTPGGAVTRMTVRESMINSHAVCHGGYVFLLADAAFAYACNSHNVSSVAAGCQVEFLRAAFLGDRLEARAEERHRGKRGGLYDINVFNQNGDLVAVVRGRSAALGKPVLSE